MKTLKNIGISLLGFLFGVLLVYFVFAVAFLSPDITTWDIAGRFFFAFVGASLGTVMFAFIYTEL